ncbi:MAG: hypothetical protein HY870_04480 [Chloroflexi bacterium]|nr:hypothetical protein [Chloroflexota bacterium]
MLRRAMLIIFLLSLAGSLLAGCGSASSTSSDHELKMAPMSMMPEAVQTAATVTQQAYQFAIANPDVMQHIPCYCGCGNTPALLPQRGASVGHTSSYSCYVKNVDGKGNVTFDSHAIGCSICVDITQDTMRLTKQGESPQEIKAYVDKTYSRFGPSNMQ